ncbi:hypothetical protein LCGC14_1556250 [marine sediment metagenome]|uniref:Uncharacterized protein n=1 Tax=marine sediment metagenome TaxID=412755 RepID=A0A0F9INU7_9ZZZZ
MNELRSSLNLEVVNKNVKIYVVDEMNEKRDSNAISSSYGVKRSIIADTYHIKLFKNYRKFFPFLLLQSAYLTFIPNNLKEMDLIDFAINQIVEFDFHEYNTVSEWKLFIREKYVNYNFVSNQSDKFRFDKFLELQERKPDENPKLFFFEYIRRNRNLNFDG